MSNQTPDWDAKQSELQGRITVPKLNTLAAQWQVNPETLTSLGVGFYNRDDAYTFPERDGSNNVIGILRRNSETGEKKMVRGSKRGLYYPSNLDFADKDTIFIPEGVSDTAVLLNLGLCAIGRPSATGGADHLVELLRNCPEDKEIVVLGENDEKDDGMWPGREGATKVAAKLQRELGRTVKIAMPPDGHKDVRDYVSHLRTIGEADICGHVLSEFRSNAEEVDDSETDTSDDMPTFRNFDCIEDEFGKQKRRGLTAPELIANHQQIFGSMPVRVGDSLRFVDDQYDFHELKNSTQLFAFLSSVAKIDWINPGDCTSQAVYCELYKLHCDAYAAVEKVPHFPRFPNVFYAHPPLPTSTGADLERLISFFTPETPEDAQLFKAFALTLFWGGSCGGRPLFLFTGPTQDPEPDKHGKGVGKSTVVQLLGELVGGTMSVPAGNVDFSKVVTRILSPGASQNRVCLVDNLKSLRFSSADFEGLITATTVSGHKMWSGEGQRPNTLVWAITVNGATMSGDLAERCVVIRLARPLHDPEWRSTVSAFIRERRWNIIADIEALLLGNEEQNHVGQINYSRFADWDKCVLAKVGDVARLNALRAERSQQLNDDIDESSIVRECIVRKMQANGGNATTGHYLIGATILANWIEEVNKDRGKPLKVTGYLKTLSIEELREQTRRAGGNYWIWRGQSCPTGSSPIVFQPRF